MRHSSTETGLEAIAREAPVKARYMADRSTTHARLGETLQRLYAPVADAEPDRIGHLLMLVEQRLAGRS
jgi:hypothetical protein